MATLFERRSMEMSPENWAALEKLARDMNAAAPSGSKYNNPSWRTLVKMIAKGEIVLTKAEGNQK